MQPNMLMLQGQVGQQVGRTRRACKEIIDMLREQLRSCQLEYNVGNNVGCLSTLDESQTNFSWTGTTKSTNDRCSRGEIYIKKQTVGIKIQIIRKVNGFYCKGQVSGIKVLMQHYQMLARLHLENHGWFWTSCLKCIQATPGLSRGSVADN